MKGAPYQGTEHGLGNRKVKQPVGDRAHMKGRNEGVPMRASA